MYNTLTMLQFSIIIPTYNRISFLTTTVASLLNQQYKEFEIIIVDDGSTDNTEEIITKITDSRVRYYKKENGERGAARNFGCQLARGEYVNFFDSDDLAYDSHLTVACDFIIKNNKPDIFHLNYDIKESDGKVIGIGPVHISNPEMLLIKNNFLSCNGVFIRKDIALTHPFPEDRRMAVAEDWALWLQLVSRYRINCLDVITSSIIMHENRSIKDWDAKKIIVRDELLIRFLFSDEKIVIFYKNKLPKFVADRYTFIMLILAMKGEKKAALQYARKAISVDKSVIFRKRFLASIKKLISK